MNKSVLKYRHRFPLSLRCGQTALTALSCREQTWRILPMHRCPYFVSRCLGEFRNIGQAQHCHHRSAWQTKENGTDQTHIQMNVGNFRRRREYIWYIFFLRRRNALEKKSLKQNKMWTKTPKQNINRNVWFDGGYGTYAPNEVAATADPINPEPSSTYTVTLPGLWSFSPVTILMHTVLAPVSSNSRARNFPPSNKLWRHN